MSSINDINAPKIHKEHGAIHPINQTKDNIVLFLQSLGFSSLDGPEIESEKFNFDMLNIKENHPARQMHDTFYVNSKKFVLRTHTSPVQIRSMLNNKPPIAIVSAGKVYRKDDDSTHLPMFHQIEGMYVGEDVNFANLKDLIFKIIHHLFDKNIEIRFRPSYFPFTEPSAEVDIRSKDGKWLEILGCGIVNPVVLENCNINSNKYSGLAFGLGVERIAMLKYQISDIREFYKSNLDFLRQFK
tara:strand:+ start:2776 stop:3501 length:726 start_codon:yes stop_codon:yes gene_type:complete